MVALALAAGLWLATWKPGGVTPRQYALAWARHALAAGAGGVAARAPTTPPRPPAGARTAGAVGGASGGEGEEELAWSD